MPVPTIDELIFRTLSPRTFFVAKIAAPTCYLLTSDVIFGFAPIGARMVVKRYFLKKFVKISRKRKEKISLIKKLCSYT